MRRCDSPTLTLFQCLQRVKPSTFFWDLHALQTLPACLLARANGCSLDRTSQTIRQEVVSREIELGNNGLKATPECVAALGGEGGGVRSSTGSAPPLGPPLQSGRCQDTSHLRVVPNCNLKFPNDQHRQLRRSDSKCLENLFSLHFGARVHALLGINSKHLIPSLSIYSLESCDRPPNLFPDAY